MSNDGNVELRCDDPGAAATSLLLKDGILGYYVDLSGDRTGFFNVWYGIRWLWETISLVTPRGEKT